MYFWLTVINNNLLSVKSFGKPNNEIQFNVEPKNKSHCFFLGTVQQKYPKRKIISINYVFLYLKDCI